MFVKTHIHLVDICICLMKPEQPIRSLPRLYEPAALVKDHDQTLQHIGGVEK